MLTCLLATAAAISLSAFRNPPDETRPDVWFHWNADCITREGLTRDIEALSDAGFRQAYVIEPAMASLPCAAKMLSPEWFELYGHALREAKRCGLRLGFINTPGWSSSGGPWITPENAMKVVVGSETDVRPGDVAGKLPQPRTNRNFYRDIAVRAFAVEPTPTFANPTPLTLKLAGTKIDTPHPITIAFEHPFAPRAVELRFASDRANVKGEIEGSVDGATWRKLGAFDYHFFFNMPEAPKLVALDDATPSKFVRITFCTSSVPEWQGSKPFDLTLKHLSFTRAPMFSGADEKSSVLSIFRYHPPANPASVGVPRADWLDLTTSLAPDGTLNWTAPARSDGKIWRVLRIGYTTTGKSPAPSTLPGLECDKLSRKGIEAHWAGMPAKLLAAPGAKDVLETLFIDSWEVMGQNWTEDFDKEFRRRRGYDLMPYLPTLLGYTVESAGTTSRVLYDLQQTVSDLIAENYFGRFAELCHEAGVTSCAQGYGGPFDSFAAQAKVDLPQSEFWLGLAEYRMTPRLQASIAHLRGRRFVTAESFTSNEAEGRWQITPHELRICGDRAWVEGVNGFVLHSYLHQPFVNLKPGISLGRHGTQLNVNTTWWPEMRQWTDYVRRGQYLLQAGEPSAELLVLCDEGTPQDFKRPAGVAEAGYHFDLCGASELLRLTNCGETVATPEQRIGYDVIFTGANQWMTIATLRKLRELVSGGAHLAGQRPKGTPSHADNPEIWKKLVEEIWSNNRVLATADAVKALAYFDVKPTVSATPHLISLRRVLPDGGSIFFVVNDRAEPFTGAVCFRAEGIGEIWDATSGTRRPFEGVLALPPHGSAFIVYTPAEDISTNWKILSFFGVNAPAAPVELPRLSSWTESADARLRYFAGRAVYEKTVVVDPTAESHVLDLGDVREIAKVSVNGHEVACLWEKPYRVTLDRRALGLTGDHLTLRVEIVNTWPNRLIGDAILRQEGTKESRGKQDIPQWVLDGKSNSGTGLSTWSNFHWAFKPESPLRPAGLIGPVTLTAANALDWNGSEWISAREAPVYTGIVSNGVRAADGTSWFAARFRNTKAVTRARWMTIGLGVYELTVNRRVVGDDVLKPGSSDPRKTRRSFTYDVTDLFNRASGAENLLAAEVSHGWWSDKIASPGNRRGFMGRKPAFRSVLEVTYADGTRETFPTDCQRWKALVSGPVTHAGIFDGEECDAREASGLDRLNEFREPERNDEFKGEILPNDGAEVVLRRDLEMARGPYSIKKGETLIVDFCQNCAAVPEFRFRAKRGTVLTALPGEMLNDADKGQRGSDGPKGSVYRANLRDGYENNFLMRYTFAGGDWETYRPRFTYFGYRYLSITATDDVEIERVTSVPVTSIRRESEAGRIETGDAALNRFIRNVYWGHLSNYLSVPTDCPQRNERLGWTGDTQIFTEAGTFNADTRRFLHKWLRDLRDNQCESGAFPCIAPWGQYTTGGAMSIGYADAGVIVPWTVWKQYGDTVVIDENWEAMERYLARIDATKYRTMDLPESGRFQWGDWLSFERFSTGGVAGHPEYAAFTDKKYPDGKAIPKPETIVYWNYLGGCYWLWDAEMMTEMARASGRDSAKYEAMCARARAYLKENFFSSEDGLILPAYRDMQTPALFALKLGLVEGEARTATIEALKKNFADNGGLRTGFLGTSILMDTLVENGLTKVAYDVLLNHNFPSWLYSVDQGATTVWERWNSYTKKDGFGPVKMNSFNHYAYGAVLAWLYKSAAGIAADTSAPGFRRIVMKPIPDRRLGHLTAEYRSATGLIKSAWRYEGKTWIWNFAIPEGATAVVTLPGEETPRTYAAGRYEQRIDVKE